MPLIFTYIKIKIEFFALKPARRNIKLEMQYIGLLSKSIEDSRELRKLHFDIQSFESD